MVLSSDTSSTTTNLTNRVGTCGPIGGLTERDAGCCILASVRYTGNLILRYPASSVTWSVRPRACKTGMPTEEDAAPVHRAAYSSESFEKVSVNQQRIIEGQGPRMKKPGGGLAATLGELLIEPRSRLCSRPKLLFLPKPALLPRPSDRCDKERSERG